MGQENFHASVQYNDFKGTAAADDHDSRSLSGHLQGQGLLAEHEILVGVQMWSGEVHEPTQNKPVYVTAIVATGKGYDSLKAAIDSGTPLHVRKIRIEMHLNEFFGFFKRFEIAISSHGLIDRQDITFED